MFATLAAFLALKAKSVEQGYLVVAVRVFRKHLGEFFFTQLDSLDFLPVIAAHTVLMLLSSGAARETYL
jgi:hypothetical protein